MEGRVIPVIDTRKRPGSPEREVELQDACIIISCGGRFLALVVDEVKPVMEVPKCKVVPSDSVVPTSGYVESVAQVEDGLIMVLTMEKTFSGDELGGLGSSLLKPGPQRSWWLVR